MKLLESHFPPELNTDLLMEHGQWTIVALKVTAGLFCIHSADGRWAGPDDPRLVFEVIGPAIYNPAAIARIENGLKP